MAVTEVCPLPDVTGYSVGFKWRCKCGKRWVVQKKAFGEKKKWVLLK